MFKSLYLNVSNRIEQFYYLVGNVLKTYVLFREEIVKHLVKCIEKLARTKGVRVDGLL